MDMLEIIYRLVGIKNNALGRAIHEASGNPLHQLEIKAYLLQSGIEQMVLEIQNSMYDDLLNDKGDSDDDEICGKFKFR